MSSLRSRLTIATAATTAAVLVVLGLSAFVSVRLALHSEFDRVLDAKARAIASHIELKGSFLEIDFGDRMPREFYETESPDYFEIWVQDGPVLAQSPSLANAHLERVDPPIDIPVFAVTTLPDDRMGRTICLSFTPQPESDDKDDVDDDDDDLDAGDERSVYIRCIDLTDRVSDDEHPAVTVVVARATTEIDELIAKLAWGAVVASVVAVLVTTLAQTWVVRRGFEPLTKVASRIEQIDERDLESRLSADGVPAEMQPVVKKLNGLLGRLSAAFEREKSFSADVAHELRTPLAGLLSTAEVAITRNRSESEYRTCLQQTVDVSKEMSDIVESVTCDPQGYAASWAGWAG